MGWHIDYIDVIAVSSPKMTQSSLSIEQFIQNLAEAKTADDAFNEYALTYPNNAIRRANLMRYLQSVLELSPHTMLVMEAPGYRGCRLTGVPVTSRKILLEGVPELDIFGKQRGFRATDEAGFERVYGEQSATIVWGTLADLKVLPFIWNTFPFHPHKAGKPLTNRKPRKPETAQGVIFLMQVMRLFDFKQVIAIGNVAYDTLTSIGISCEKVRHPAQGGKNDFVEGLTRLLK